MAHYYDGSRVVYWDDSNQSLTIPGTLTVNNFTGGNQINIPAQSVVFGNLYNATAYSTNTVLTVGNLYNSNYYNTNVISIVPNFAQSFTSVGSLGNFYSIAISITGQFQLCGAIDDFLYISSDFGLNWAAVGPIGNWESVGMSQSGGYMYAADFTLETGNLYRSIDYGLTWTLLNLAPGRWKSIGVSATGQYVLAGGPLSMYVSSDFGATFNSVFSTSQGGGSASVSATGQYMIMTTSSQSAYVSSNYGRNWTLVSGPPLGSSVVTAISGSGQYQVVSAYYTDIFGNNVESLWLSSNYGVTFTNKVTSTVLNTDYGAITMDYTGQYMVATVKNTNPNYGVLYSIDFGTTWSLSPSLRGANIVGCAISANGQYLTIPNANGGSIFVSNIPTALNVYGSANITQTLLASSIITNSLVGTTLSISSIGTTTASVNIVGALEANNVSSITSQTAQLFATNSYVGNFTQSSLYILAANINGGLYGSTLTMNYSYDLSNWTPIRNSFVSQATRVKKLNGIYFAVGWNNDNATKSPIMVSLDGINWNYPILFPNTGGYIVFYNVFYGGGRYVAAGGSGCGGAVWHSDDGVRWVASSTSSTGGFFYPDGSCSSSGITGMAYGNGKWVLIGGGATDKGVYWSGDGINFTYTNSNPIKNGGAAISFDGTKFIQVGNDFILGNPSRFDWRWSTDGITWSSSGFSGTTSWRGIPTDILYNGTSWLAIGNIGTFPVIDSKFSYDGFQWSDVPSEGFLQSTQYNYLSWSGERWFAGVVASTISLAYSDDGSNWTGVNVPNINTTTNQFNNGNSVYAFTEPLPTTALNVYGSGNVTQTLTTNTLVSSEESFFIGDVYDYNSLLLNNFDYSNISTSFVQFSNASGIPFTSFPYKTGFPAISGNGQVHLIAGVSTLWRSTDYGYSWVSTPTLTSLLMGVPSLSVSGKIITIATLIDFDTPNYIYTSYDYGSNWTRGSLLKSWWRYTAMSASGKYQLAGTKAEYIYTSSDYGVTWNPVTSIPIYTPDLWRGAAISATGQYQAFGRSQIHVSNDYGVTWTLRTNFFKPGGFGIRWETVSMSASGQYMFATSDNHFSYQSSDYGTTWTVCPSLITPVSAGMSYSGQYVIASSGYNSLFSSDYGSNFKTTNSPTMGPAPYYAVAIGGTPQYMMALGQDSGAFYSFRSILPTLFASIKPTTILSQTIVTSTITANSIIAPIFGYSTLGNNSQFYTSNSDSGRTFLLDVANENSTIFWLPSTSLINRGWNCKVVNMNASGVGSNGSIFVSSPQASAQLYSQLSQGRTASPFVNVTGGSGSIYNYNYYANILYDGSNFYAIR